MTRTALAATLALALAGCAQDLQLRRDERLRFLFPPDRAELRAPIVIRWEIDPREFRATGFDGSADPRRGAFAVFIDRSPMRPGSGVASLARRDLVCRHSPGCPDRDWLARRGVWVTRRPAIALPALRHDSGREVGDRRRHEVTVVLLDGRGRRIGETAWSRAFYTREEE